MPTSLKKKVLEMSKSLMHNLFKSNEHTERQSALKIFGCLLGLRSFVDNKDNRFGRSINENLNLLKYFIERIFEATFDWDEKTVEIAENLC